MRVLVTGSAQGLGRDTATALLDDGHDVLVHVRSRERRRAVEDLAARGAGVVVADLGDLEQVRDLAQQVETVDSIVHSAGVIGGADLLTVNVLAPYVLTALVPTRRHIYLSSSMHRSGRPRLDPLTAGGSGAATYSDSKLLVTILAAAVARKPDTVGHAVDPGWVPTRMGGAGAPDDLHLGHVTQQWPATTGDPAAATFGYWHHQRRQQPHPAVLDVELQDRLTDALAALTGVRRSGTVR